MREYFLAYHSMLEAMRKLSDAEVGRLFRGLLHYSMTEEQPDNLQGREELLFDVFSQQIDRERAKYQRKCETNRENVSRRYATKATTGNDRIRSYTNVYESYQYKEEDEEEYKEKDKHHHEDDDARARISTVEAYATGNLQHLSPRNMEELGAFKDELTEDLIRFAIDEACANGAPRWAYVRAVLDGFKREGIKTVGDAKAAKEKRKANGGKTGASKPRNYDVADEDWFF